MEDEKEDLEIVTNYSPIVQFGIWFFSSKKFPQYNSKGEYVNLQTRPAKYASTSRDKEVELLPPTYDFVCHTFLFSPFWKEYLFPLSFIGKLLIPTFTWHV